MEIRRAVTETALSEAFSVRRAVFVDEQGVDEAIEIDGNDGEALQFLARDDGEAVGTARLRRPEPGVGKVERVAVRKPYRGRGVGRALMKAAEAAALRVGCRELRLHGQTRVEPFYRRLGYEPEGEPFEEAGIPHLAFRKPLEDRDGRTADAPPAAASTAAGDSPAVMPKGSDPQPMRQARFEDPDGDIRYGELLEDGTIRAFPKQGNRLTATEAQFDREAVELLAPCDPSKIVCVGLNYADHAAEQGKEVPARPLLFLKTPNTVAAPEDTLELLSNRQLDYEAELGVVIGERCRNVDADDAIDVVAGFTCVNDVSNRDDQAVETNWVRGKAFDDAAPLGPAIATPDMVPEDAAVRCRVNGDLRQDSSREQFIFSVPELVAEITSYMTLEPGDVISTGTPEGVGPLADGDTVEVEIEGVGTLTNKIRIP